jgi:hypothetical protein
MTERYLGVQAMAVTTFEKGVQAGFEKCEQAGLEKGLQQGQRLTLQKQLEARFGTLSQHARLRFESLNQQQLEQLTVALLKAHSLQELGLED